MRESKATVVVRVPPDVRDLAHQTARGHLGRPAASDAEAFGVLALATSDGALERIAEAVNRAQAIVKVAHAIVAALWANPTVEVSYIASSGTEPRGWKLSSEGREPVYLGDADVAAVAAHCARRDVIIGPTCRVSAN